MKGVYGIDFFYKIQNTELYAEVLGNFNSVELRGRSVCLAPRNSVIFCIIPLNAQKLHMVYGIYESKKRKCTVPVLRDWTCRNIVSD
jgi:hypothetical protein